MDVGMDAWIQLWGWMQHQGAPVNIYTSILNLNAWQILEP